QLACVMGEDIRTDDPALSRSDDFHQPACAPLGPGAVVLGERPAKHSDPPVVARCLRLAHSDMRKLRLGEGHPGQEFRPNLSAEAKYYRADDETGLVACPMSEARAGRHIADGVNAPVAGP